MQGEETSPQVRLGCLNALASHEVKFVLAAGDEVLLVDQLNDEQARIATITLPQIQVVRKSPTQFGQGPASEDFQPDAPL